MRSKITLLIAFALLAFPASAAATKHRHHHRHHHHTHVVAVHRTAPAPTVAHRADTPTEAEEEGESCVSYEPDGTCVGSETVNTPGDELAAEELEKRAVCIRWEGARCVEDEIPYTPGELSELEAEEVARLTEEEEA